MLSNKSNPLVSIIIPVFNRADLFLHALESAISQTYRNIEILVVDDGSDLDIKTLIKVHFDNNKIKFYKQENSGVAVARNRGMIESNGAYLVFLDSDDILEPKMVERLIKTIHNSNEYDMACGSWKMIDQNEDAISGYSVPSYLQNETDKDFTKALLIKGLFPIHAVLVKKTSTISKIFFNPQLKAFEDWEFWLRISLAASKIKFIDDPVCSWRVHANYRRSDIGSINEIEQTIDNLTQHIDTLLVDNKNRDFINNRKLQFWIDQANYFSLTSNVLYKYCIDKAVECAEFITFEKDFLIHHLRTAKNKLLRRKLKYSIPKQYKNGLLFEYELMVGLKGKNNYKNKVILFLLYPLQFAKYYLNKFF